MFRLFILLLVLSEKISDDEADKLYIELAHKVTPISWRDMRDQIEEVLGRKI